MKTDQVLFEIGVRRTGVAAITLLAVLFLVSEAFGAKPTVGSEAESGFKLS
jgi:hypothetical protein